MVMQYKAASEATRQALAQAGLTGHQAALYEALIQHGPQKATRLAFLAGVPRTLSYKVLEELAAKGLVGKKDQQKGVSVFSPTHPLVLMEGVKQRIAEAEEAKTALHKLVLEFDAMLGTISGQSLYTKVASYASRASMGPLSATERAEMRDALEAVLKSIEK